MAIAEVPSAPAAPLTSAAAAPLAEPLPRASVPTEAEGFYALAPEVDELRDSVEVQRHVPLPASVIIVVAEVSGAGAAVEAGHQRAVNAAAAACIAAVRNALPGLDVPYLFTGHGARLVVPGSKRGDVERALRGVRDFARTALELDLRVGVVPLAELLEAGCTARIARQRVSAQLKLAAFSGDAFATAERWATDPLRRGSYALVSEGEAGACLEGLHCRWQPLPSRRGHIVTLLLMALAATEEERSRTYRSILRAFETIVDCEACHPVKKDGLRALRPWEDRSLEARIAAHAKSGSGTAGGRERSLMSRVLRGMGFGPRELDPGRHKKELVENTDYRRFDDGLRMVVDLSPEELYRFESRLGAEQRAGRIAYGLHSATAALVTSVVRSFAADHVHFVDGLGGGACSAAEQLEARLAARRAG